MDNYFDYISESADLSVDERDDVVYDEMCATLYEFDLYIQESVGINVLIGIGVAAALGGLIALIIKLFSAKEATSATTKTSKAKSDVNKAKSAGVTTVTVSTKNGVSAHEVIDATKEQTKNTVDAVNEYKNFVEKYFDSISTFLEDINAKYPDNSDQDKRMTALKKFASKTLDQMLDDFPHLKNLLGSNTKAGAKANVKKFIKLSNKAKNETDPTKAAKAERDGIELTGKMIKGALDYAQTLDITDVDAFVSNTLADCKALLFSGKGLSKNGKRLQSILQKMGVSKKDAKLTVADFDKITAALTEDLNEAFSMISDNMEALSLSINEELKNVL